MKAIIGIPLGIIVFILGMLAMVFYTAVFGIKWILGFPVTINVTIGKVTEKRTYRWGTLLKTVKVVE
jgi:hypothetical protein